MGCPEGRRELSTRCKFCGHPVEHHRDSGCMDTVDVGGVLCFCMCTASFSNVRRQLSNRRVER